MVFRAAAGIATLLIGLNQAVAQYYPPTQAYPRQPLPPAVSTEELPPLNAPVVRGDALSPPVGVRVVWQVEVRATDAALHKPEYDITTNPYLPVHWLRPAY